MLERGAAERTEPASNELSHAFSISVRYNLTMFDLDTISCVIDRTVHISRL